MCCAACLCKIKENGHGQHFYCYVCSVNKIKEEKKNKLLENIKYLEQYSGNIEDSLNKLKEIYEQMNKSKEEIKQKIINEFTKIRNLINEREDKLLSELDNIYEKEYFKEDIIKKGEKLPQHMKGFLEKGKELAKKWDDKEIKLITKINDCLNIENNIKNIIEINKNIENFKSKKINIKFSLIDNQIINLSETINQIGEVYNEEGEDLKFKFKAGTNYNTSNNGLIATKHNGGDDWNCVIIGEKEIPKNRKSKWKIRINKNKERNKNYNDIYIGIGPNAFKGNLYSECWSIYSSCYHKVQLQLKQTNNSNYNNHQEDLKEGDIIEVIADRIKGDLSFSINGVNYGTAFSNIPKDETLFPTIILYEQGLIVELV